MQAGLWTGCAVAVLVALLSGWRDWARARRRNLDAIGPVDWRTVQMVALGAAMLLGSLAFNTGAGAIAQ